MVSCLTDNRIRTVAEVTMKAANETELAGDDAMRMQKIIDTLESLDDVQDVYTSAVFS
jgi:transcriptional/translational regulatory protein YebC/TACO1